MEFQYQQRQELRTGKASFRVLSRDWLVSKNLHALVAAPLKWALRTLLWPVGSQGRHKHRAHTTGISQGFTCLPVCW